MVLLVEFVYNSCPLVSRPEARVVALSKNDNGPMKRAHQCYVCVVQGAGGRRLDYSM